MCVELTSTALAGVRCTRLHYTAVWALHNACAALPCELHLPSANAALEYAALACAALSSLQVCVSCVCLRRAGVELCLHMHMHCAGVRHACHTAALGWATGHLRALQMPALHSSGVCDTPATAALECVGLHMHMHMHCAGVCVTLATAALGWAIEHFACAAHAVCYGSVRCKMPALRSCEMHSPTHTQRSSTLHSCALHLPAQRSGA